MSEDATDFGFEGRGLPSRQGLPSTWYRAIFDAAPDGIVLMDAEGSIRDVNGEATRMFDYEREELLGQPVEVLVPDRVRAAHADHRRAYVADPHPRPMGIGMELRGRRKDGTTLPVEISLSPLETPDGQLVISVIRDITERRRLRNFGLASLRAAEDERQRIARELHDDTAQALSTLLLRMTVARRTGEASSAAHLLDEIHREISEVVAGVRRISRGLRPPALDDAGVVAALQGHLRTVENSPGTRASLEFEAETVDPVLDQGDRLVLYRVVQEALANAVRHADASWIGVELRRNGEAVLVRVRDDGRGFDPSDPRVGDRGLGLVGMRERATLAGGRLRIESREGEGTTVELEIPTNARAQESRGA